MPTVVYGPGGKWIAHQVDEFVEVAAIVEAAEVYREAALRFLAAPTGWPWRRLRPSRRSWRRLHGRSRRPLARRPDGRGRERPHRRRPGCGSATTSGSAGWRTGTTVVLPPPGTLAGVEVRGGGPGTRETDALDPRNLVPHVHAVCLTGRQRLRPGRGRRGDGAGWRSRAWAIPVGTDPDQVVPDRPGRGPLRPGPGRDVPAIAPDAGVRLRGDGRGGTGPAGPPRSSRAASGRRPGAAAGGARRRDRIGQRRPRRTAPTVAALVAVNAAGAVFDDPTPASLLRRTRRCSRPTPAVRRPARRRGRRRGRAAGSPAAARTPLNTTIGVVATDAVLAPGRGPAAGRRRPRRPGPGRPPVPPPDRRRHVLRLATGARARPAARRLRAERPAPLNLLLAAAADVVDPGHRPRRPRRPQPPGSARPTGTCSRPLCPAAPVIR